MTKRLSLAAVFLFGLSATSAFADCVLDTPPDPIGVPPERDAIYRCTGITETGFNRDFFPEDITGRISVSVSASSFGLPSNLSNVAVPPDLLDNSTILLGDGSNAGNTALIEYRLNGASPANQAAVSLGDDSSFGQFGGNIISENHGVVLGENGFASASGNDRFEVDGDAFRGRNNLGLILDTLTAGDNAVDTQGFDGLEVTARGVVTSRNTVINAGPNASGQGGNNLVLEGVGILRSIEGRGVVAGDNASIVIEPRGFVFPGTDAGIDAFGTAIDLGQNAEVRTSGYVTSSGGSQEAPVNAIQLQSGNVEVYLDGRISSRTGPAVHFLPGSNGGYVGSTNGGQIAGVVGISVSENDTGDQFVVNDSQITGTSGISVSLGGGNDQVLQTDFGQFEGAVRLGDGDDRFRLVRFEDGQYATSAVVHGGLGTDQFQADEFAFGDLSGVALLPTPTGLDGLSFSLIGEAGTAEFELTSFERFLFSDTPLDAPLSFEDIAGTTINAVPLPASVWMMLLAFGGLGIMKRRAKA